MAAMLRNIAEILNFLRRSLQKLQVFRNVDLDLLCQKLHIYLILK